VAGGDVDDAHRNVDRFGRADDQDSGDGRRREYSGCKHLLRPLFEKPKALSSETLTSTGRVQCEPPPRSALFFGSPKTPA